MWGEVWWAVLKLQNRTRRSLSSPQIHQKLIQMLNKISTEQLLNTGRGHQAPRKAAHFPLKEVGQNIKDKKRDKRVWDRDLS